MSSAGTGRISRKFMVITVSSTCGTITGVSAKADHSWPLRLSRDLPAGVPTDSCSETIINLSAEHGPMLSGAPFCPL